ncbi:MAG: hypothetical protein EZS28_020581 [Streblomastix strix]|uniref:Uncharacterized protein n=1 Tax=Streblomastix strix TaxID=222440 RepID=A0A5J4VMZ0_9EUKA|nr:MAG: hypothetical protein EZS28_020581 [Streblomastix strix]
MGVKIPNGYVINAGNSVSFAGGTCGVAQINPNGNNYNQGIRISGSSTDNYGGIFLCCNPISTVGTYTGQRSIFVSSKGELWIGISTQVNQANQGLIISADGNKLSFNGSAIAGTGVTNVATNGSVNYSAGNPILWGTNSVGTEGAFYCDGAKVYWRAKFITLGSIPP